MQLSQNQKIFSEFFPAFPQSTSNYEYFRKNFEPDGWYVTDIIDWKKRSYLKGQKAPYQNSYGQSTC